MEKLWVDADLLDIGDDAYYHAARVYENFELPLLKTKSVRYQRFRLGSGALLSVRRSQPPGGPCGPCAK